MPALNDAYERNRRISSADDPHGPTFRPRLGATVELFGSPVTLGPQHALGLIGAFAFAGLEGVFAIVVIFLGFLLLRSQPLSPTPPDGAATGGAPAPRQRQPGLWGAIMHFIGPVPEGAAVTLGNGLGGDDDGASASVSSGGRAVEAAGHSTARSTAVPPSSASDRPFDETKAKATRAAAARAAAARFEAAAQSSVTS